MDREHPVSVYISTAKTLFIRQNTACLWNFNTFFCRDTAIQNTEKDGLSSLSSPSDTNSESDTLKKIKKGLSIFKKHRESFNYPLCVTGGTRCPPWSTQQKKCLHGENELYRCRCPGGGWLQSTDVMLLCVERREVYRQLRSIYPSLACRQFMDGLLQLEKECGYGEERIPQLREVSAFLKGDTDWKLRRHAKSYYKLWKRQKK